MLGICHSLEVTYESTSQLKEFKINILVHKYELFKMHDIETISDMFTRFTNIINGLKALRGDISDVHWSVKFSDRFRRNGMYIINGENI